MSSMVKLYTEDEIDEAGFSEYTAEQLIEENKKRSYVGYCSSVVGTEFHRKAVRSKKLVYELSNCHTLDRENFRAQKDECGIGTKTE